MKFEYLKYISILVIGHVRSVSTHMLKFDYFYKQRHLILINSLSNFKDVRISSGIRNNMNTCLILCSFLYFTKTCTVPTNVLNKYLYQHSAIGFYKNALPTFIHQWVVIFIFKLSLFLSNLKMFLSYLKEIPCTKNEICTCAEFKMSLKSSPRFYKLAFLR